MRTRLCRRMRAKSHSGDLLLSHHRIAVYTKMPLLVETFCPPDSHSSLFLSISRQLWPPVSTLLKSHGRIALIRIAATRCAPPRTTQTGSTRTSYAIEKRSSASFLRFRPTTGRPTTHGHPLITLLFPQIIVVQPEEGNAAFTSSPPPHHSALQYAL